MTTELDINLVYPNPHQPRQFFDAEKLNELAESIKEVGLISPIAVKENGDGYQIIHGERRWRACKIAGLQTIRAEIKNASDTEAYTISIIENEQREDISPIETAEALHKLMTEKNLTQNEVARRISKTRTWVAQKMRLLNLPDEVKTLVEKNELTEGHARQLLKLQTAGLNDQSLQIAKNAVSKNLSVAQLQTEVDMTLAGESVSYDTEPLRVRQFKSLWRDANEPERQAITAWIIGFQGIQKNVSCDTSGGVL